MTLQANCEYRFHAIDAGITVTDGIAEVFGTEMANQVLYTFVSCHCAISTYHGCKLEINGAFEFNYTGSESNINLSYLNLAFALHQQERATVLVLGSRYSGKTTLVKRLANYTVKRGNVPFIVDLDIGKGGVTVPGTLSAMPLETPLDPCCGTCMSFSHTTSKAESMPIVYYYGYSEMKQHADLYDSLLVNLKESIDEYDHCLLYTSPSPRD